MTQTTTLQSTTPTPAPASHQPAQWPLPHVMLAPGVDAGAASYVQHLEAMFLELRGQGVQWTPDDVERAGRWRDLGISLATTRRVLHARLASWRAMHGTTPAPYSLRYYEPAVLSALGGRFAVAGGGARDAGNSRGHTGLGLDTAHAKESESAANGDTGADSDTDSDPWAVDPSALQLLADLAHSGAEIARSSRDPAVADATKRAVATLRKAVTSAGDGTRTLDCPDTLDAIAAAREIMRKRLLRGIGAAARTALEAAASAKDSAALDHDAASRRHVLWQETLLSEQLGARWPMLDGWQLRTMRPADRSPR